VQSPDLDGFDAVVHLAGLSNDPLGSLNPDLTYEINHLATIRLARLAKEMGTQRFLFSSTCSIYGAAGEDMVSEDSQALPRTPYGHSKLLAERDVATLADSSFSPTFLRSATAYGVSPCLRFDLVLNNLVAWAYTTGRVYLKSDGKAWRPVVHVEDIARAFIAVLRAPRDAVHGHAFNVGRSEENYRIRDLAELVGATVLDSHIEYARDAGSDTRSYRVDFGKLARTLPEFTPRWNARRGARQLYETCREASLSLDAFEGPRYRRVLHIEELLRDGRLDATMRRREEELG
jgi:nucleoside-diphosphate-sugar epimerase